MYFQELVMHIFGMLIRRDTFIWFEIFSLDFKSPKFYKRQKTWLLCFGQRSPEQTYIKLSQKFSPNIDPLVPQTHCQIPEQSPKFSQPLFTTYRFDEI